MTMKQDKYKVFCECGEKHDPEKWMMCADPEMVVKALNDAKDEMSYSNWHNDKLDRVIKLVKAYAQQSGIKFDFNKDTYD